MMWDMTKIMKKILVIFQYIWRCVHDTSLPVSISDTLELHCEQTHEGRTQSTARDQIFSHQGWEQVNVERRTV